MKIPEQPPDVEKIIEMLTSKNPGLLLEAIRRSSPLDNKGRYCPWQKLKFLDPPAKEISHEIWWSLIKIARNNTYKILPIKGTDGKEFRFNIIDSFQQTLHYLDQYASGNISIDKPILDKHLKDTYLVSSLMEESITSSQLEGATTTRAVAKQMIKEERNPKDKSERMILNNYRAIQFVRSVKNEDLSPELIKELHSIVSDKTLDNSKKSGIYRDKEDDIHISSDNEIVYTPPGCKEIKKRIHELCRFANTDNFTVFFIHPVVKAIFIHFYLSYVHPFVDGNGRTARALFYWYMLKKGYWLTEFISISRILKNAPAKYGLSFLYVETDDNDLSYFIDHQLKVIKKSIDDLQIYLEKKLRAITNTEMLLENTDLSHKLNMRQLSLIKDALKSPGKIYTITEHKNTHATAYETARKDLLLLSDKYKLFLKIKEGKSFVFVVPSNLKERLKKST